MVELKTNKMAQLSISGNAGESLLNIFPNPCKGGTYLYTDDLEAAWVVLFDPQGNQINQWQIIAGKTLHIQLSLTPGTYQLVLKDAYQNIMGGAKPLFISESH
jgi:hypothetical protein